MNFQIISDGACDLLPEYTTANQIEIVPFYVAFEGEEYTKEGEGISHDEFYRRMAENHEIPKSSLPSSQDYMDVFLPFVEKQIPIICICITAKFSGSYNSACVAKEQILEDYKDAQIEVIDSTLNTMSEALLVNEAVQMRNKGFSYENCIDTLQKIKQTGRIYFTVGSLEYLIKNGRIGKLASVAGDKLGIQPLIIMKDGEISLGGATRSRKKAKDNVIKLIQKYFKEAELNYSDYRFLVGTGFQMEEAAEFCKMLEEALPITCEEIPARIGTTIGCHTGPYPLGVAFIKRHDA